MSVQDTWLTNLRKLIDELAPRDGDKRAAFREVALRAGLAEEYIYQLYQGKPKADGTARTMGTRAAKAIARAFADGRDPGWFDRSSLEVDERPISSHPQTNAPDASISELLKYAPAADRKRLLDDLRIQLVKARAKYVAEDLDRLFSAIDALEQPSKRIN